MGPLQCLGLLHQQHPTRVFRAVTRNGPPAQRPIATPASVPAINRSVWRVGRRGGAAAARGSGPRPFCPDAPTGSRPPMRRRRLPLWIPGADVRGDPGWPTSSHTRGRGSRVGRAFPPRASTPRALAHLPRPRLSPPRPLSPVPPPRLEGSQLPLLTTSLHPGKSTVGSLVWGGVGRFEQPIKRPQSLDHCGSPASWPTASLRSPPPPRVLPLTPATSKLLNS